MDNNKVLKKLRRIESILKEKSQNYMSKIFSKPSDVTYRSDRADKTIKGRVTTEEGEGLPGVNILIKGATVGTVTDVSGNYAIEVPEETKTLIFSYVGYICGY